MQSKATTVAAYLDELPADRRRALEELRALIREEAPGAVEGIQYGMLSYAVGEVLCSLASQKGYMALYVGPGVLDAYRARLGKLDCGKGCIRFRRLEDLPLDVVREILRENVRRRRSSG